MLEATPGRTPIPAKDAIWIGPSVPDELRMIALERGIPIASSATNATMILDISPIQDELTSQWFYALVAPFPTILDGVSIDDLRAVWGGSSTQSYANWPLWMTSTTQSAFSAIWGAPEAAVRIASEDELLDRAWQQIPSWAIIPFESIEPRWKVLTVDGNSPIRKDFAAATYPLQHNFRLSSLRQDPPQFSLPEANRDVQKMTTIIMSGTSGLVREIAYQMEVLGISYPARDIGDVLRQADILHVSHETPFNPTCPPPNPRKNRFYCGDPKYIGLFDDIGVDVVEVTGNHIMDDGTSALLFTLELYRKHKMMYFGGGVNLVDAQKPLLVENHGNRLAFLGCNAGEPPQPLAQHNLPGANPCNWKQFTTQIRQLRNQGYIPIVTFQYKEGYSPMVMPWQSLDFRKAADAGALIVSGSQSHVPLQMEFFGDAFIHYGLGNFFFGQMANQPPGPGLPLQPAQRFEFLDRHVIYDNRYISTELLTNILEDYARPRPMTTDERAALLTSYFGYSGWLPLIPTPGPEETPTLYPPLKFIPLPTQTIVPNATGTP